MNTRNVAVDAANHQHLLGSGTL